MVEEIFDYPAYLSAKKAIDDKSINRQVWLTMCHWLQHRQAQKNRVKILEIGAGIGTMIERIIDEAMVKDCFYTAIEQEPEFKDHAFDRLSENNRFTMVTDDSRWDLSSGNTRLTIEWLSGDAMEINQILEQRDYDLVLSHAVIDLLPVPLFLPRLFKHLKSDGGYYFSMNFSGKTEFSPGHTDDEIIYNAYHQDMDSRFNNIDWQPSRTGILLGEWLINQGHNVLATGPSDWILSSHSNTDDNLFIENILQTIEKALIDLPYLESWLDTRRQQLKSGELWFSASNIDYFGFI
ncbi:MAG: class I SAM-dependent methyltransferase [Gammaproteobacteria bacterium]|nr:class I SAM-dependent methyltransferase [Gammaproteobacteria bacterium]